MSEILIRSVERDDHREWLLLWEGYNAFYGRSGASGLAAEITEATWRRFFDPAEPMHALVAEQGGALVGLAHYLFHRSTTALEMSCYMQDLFTAERARGKGVARTLIQNVYDAARQAGSPRVYWQTHESNHGAQVLYDAIAERSGFVVYRKLL